MIRRVFLESEDGSRESSRPERDLSWRRRVWTFIQEVCTFASYHMDTSNGTRTTEIDGTCTNMTLPFFKDCKYDNDSGQVQNLCVLKLQNREHLSPGSWPSSIGYTAISPPPLSDPSSHCRCLPDFLVSAIAPHTQCAFIQHTSLIIIIMYHVMYSYVSSVNKVYFNCVADIFAWSHPIKLLIIMYQNVKLCQKGVRPLTYIFIVDS